MSGYIGEAFVRVRADTRGMRGEVEKGTKTAIVGAAKTAAGLVGVYGGFKFFESAIKDAASEQKALTSLRASVKATGEAYRVHGQDLDVVLKKMREATGTPLEDLTQGLLRLVTATGSVSKGYRDLGIAQDVAIARHTSLAQSAVILARAEGGSDTALRRLGIILPKITKNVDELRQQHDQAVASGTKFTGQQKLQYKQSLLNAAALDKEATRQNIISELQRRFGGQTAIFASTAAGQYARLRETVKGLSEDIGGALLPSLSHGAESVAGLVRSLRESSTFQRGLTDTVHLLGEGFHGLAVSIRTVSPLLLGLARVGSSIGKFLDVGAVFAAAAAYKGAAIAITFAQAAQARWTAITTASIGPARAHAAAEVQEAAATDLYTLALEANTIALRFNAAAVIGNLAAQNPAAAITLTRALGGLTAGTAAAGEGAVVAGSRFGGLATRVGLGLRALATGPTAITIGVAALAYGLYRLSQREGDLERANHSLQTSLSELDTAFGKVRTTAESLTQLRLELPALRAAKVSAELAIQRDRLDVSNQRASGSTLALREAENRLAADQANLAQVAHDLLVAQQHVGESATHLADLRVDAEKKVQDAIRRTTELATAARPQTPASVSLNQNVEGRAAQLAARRIAQIHTFAAGLRDAASAERDRAKTLAETDPAEAASARRLAHNYSLLANISETLRGIPTRKVISVVLQLQGGKTVTEALAAAGDKAAQETLRETRRAAAVTTADTADSITKTSAEAAHTVTVAVGDFKHQTSSALADARYSYAKAQQSLRDTILSGKLTISDAQKSLADTIKQGSKDVADSVNSAKQNLNTLGSSLAQAIGNFIDKGVTGADADKLPKALQAQFDRLKNLVDSGVTGPMVDQLSAKLTGQLQAHAAAAGTTTDAQTKRKDRITREFSDLTALRNANLISEQRFEKSITRILEREGINRHNIRKRLGVLAGQEYSSLLTGLFGQGRAEAKGPQQPGSGIAQTIVKPLDALKKSQQDTAAAQQTIVKAQSDLIRNKADAQHQVMVQQRDLQKLERDDTKAIRDDARKAAERLYGIQTNQKNVAMTATLVEQKGGKFTFAIKPLAATKKAMGGPISGPSGIDTVPALLTAGEIVINAPQQQGLRRRLGMGGGSPHELFGAIRRFQHGGVASDEGSSRFEDGGIVGGIVGAVKSAIGAPTRAAKYLGGVEAHSNRYYAAQEALTKLLPHVEYTSGRVGRMAEFLADRDFRTAHAGGREYRYEDAAHKLLYARVADTKGRTAGVEASASAVKFATGESVTRRFAGGGVVGRERELVRAYENMPVDGGHFGPPVPSLKTLGRAALGIIGIDPGVVRQRLHGNLFGTLGPGGRPVAPGEVTGGTAIGPLGGPLGKFPRGVANELGREAQAYLDFWQVAKPRITRRESAIAETISASKRYARREEELYAKDIQSRPESLALRAAVKAIGHQFPELADQIKPHHLYEATSNYIRAGGASAEYLVDELLRLARGRDPLVAPARREANAAALLRQRFPGLQTAGEIRVEGPAATAPETITRELGKLRKGDRFAATIGGPSREFKVLGRSQNLNQVLGRGEHLDHLREVIVGPVDSLGRRTGGSYVFSPERLVNKIVSSHETTPGGRAGSFVQQMVEQELQPKAVERTLAQKQELVHGLLARRFAHGGVVQKFAHGGVTTGGTAPRDDSFHHRDEGAHAKLFSLPGRWLGLLKRGNINLLDRPNVPNHGASSSVYSTSFEDRFGREVLIPQVIKGFGEQPDKIVGPKKAWAHYLQTGRELGIFDSPKHANRYAEALHREQEHLGLGGGGTKFAHGGVATGGTLPRGQVPIGGIPLGLVDIPHVTSAIDHPSPHVYRWLNDDKPMIPMRRDLKEWMTSRTGGGTSWAGALAAAEWWKKRWPAQRKFAHGGVTTGGTLKPGQVPIGGIPLGEAVSGDTGHIFSHDAPHVWKMYTRPSGFTGIKTVPVPMRRNIGDYDRGWMHDRIGDGAQLSRAVATDAADWWKKRWPAQQKFAGGGVVRRMQGGGVATPPVGSPLARRNELEEIMRLPPGQALQALTILGAADARNRAIQYRAERRTPHGPGWFAAQVIGHGVDQLRLLPGGQAALAKQLVTHPISGSRKFIGQQIHSLGETIHHPIRQLKNEPLTFAGNLALGFGALRGAAGVASRTPGGRGLSFETGETNFLRALVADERGSVRLGGGLHKRPGVEQLSVRDLFEGGHDLYDEIRSSKWNEDARDYGTAAVDDLRRAAGIKLRVYRDRKGMLEGIASYALKQGNARKGGTRGPSTLEVGNVAAGRGGLGIFKDLVGIAAGHDAGIDFYSGPEASELYAALGAKFEGGSRGISIPPAQVAALNKDLFAYARAAQVGRHTPPGMEDLVGEELAAQSKSAARFLPPGVGSRLQLAKLYRNLDRMLVEGLPFGKDWYTESGKAILRYVGGDVDRADQLAALTAIYSPQRAVVPNIGLATQVLEEFRRKKGKVPEGEEITVGHDWQKAAARKAIEGGDWRDALSPDGALKIRSFYGNLLKNINKTRMRKRGYTGNEVTADGWMGAAFGFGRNTNTVQLSTGQYRFIERTVQSLARRHGISPEEAQAAIWVVAKAKADRGLQERYAAGGETRTGALRAAGSSFREGLEKPEHTVRLALEAASSAKADWQSKLSKRDFRRYTHAIGRNVLGEIHRLGVPARLTDESLGSYINNAGQLEMNPAAALELVVGNRPSSARLTLGRNSRPFYDSLGATIGDALSQEGVGWLRPLRQMSQKESTAWHVNLGRRPSEKEYKRIWANLSPKRYFVTQADDGFTIVRSGQGHLKLSSKIDQLVQARELAKEAGNTGLVAKYNDRLQPLREQQQRSIDQIRSEVQTAYDAGFGKGAFKAGLKDKQISGLTAAGGYTPAGAAPAFLSEFSARLRAAVAATDAQFMELARAKHAHGGVAAPLRFATGGIVPGPIGAGDVVPSLLSPGELVISKPQRGRLESGSEIAMRQRARMLEESQRQTRLLERIAANQHQGDPEVSQLRRDLARRSQRPAGHNADEVAELSRVRAVV